MSRTNWGDMARYQVVLSYERFAEAFIAQIRPFIERIISGICESRTFAALLLPKLISDELRVEDAKQIVGRCV